MRLFEANNFFLPPASWRRSFFVTLFFVTLAALLFWLDSFRLYESEIRVLVIGKSPSAATDQVVENFAELVGNLSFYERVLTGNDLIDDDFSGYAPDKRKALWNEAVRAKRSDSSGVLIITARQDTGEKAKLLGEETVKTLFSVASFYYNIQTDVDLRVVDSAIVRTTVRSPLQYVLTSFGSAFLLTVLFFWLLSVMPFFFEERRPVSFNGTVRAKINGDLSEKIHQDFVIGSSVPFIDPRKFVPARPAALSFESSHGEQQIRDEISAPLVKELVVDQTSMTTSSERMLPGMDVKNLPFEFEDPSRMGEFSNRPKEYMTSESMEFEKIPPETDITADELESEPVKTSEPTVEEYKRRLNELLSGGK